MWDINLKCWKSGCDVKFDLSIRDHDQAIYCDKCRDARTFVNLAALDCVWCRHKNRIPVANWGLMADNLRCESCQQQLTNISDLRVLPIDEFLKDEFSMPYEEMEGCHRDQFESKEADAKQGMAALDRLAPAGVNAVYINRSADERLPNLPIESLRQYHLCCNFKIWEGKNSKLAGTLAGFARRSNKVPSKSRFEWLLGTHKVQTVWFANELVRRDFIALPPLAFHRNLFRIA